MVNTLFLPELREMLAEQNQHDLVEFCNALHPGRTAEYMEGLEPHEAWAVLRYAEPALRAEIFSYFEFDRQLELLRSEDPAEVAEMLVELPADDRVDLLQELDEEEQSRILPLMGARERRESIRLQEYKPGTAGSLMTTEFARLSAKLNVRQALEELSQQAEHLETIYYVYVVDDNDQLSGVVSGRRLISALAKPQTRLSDMMETDLVIADVDEDQESVMRKVARYDLLAIPVVDHHRHPVGIITHDDVIDVVQEEALEDVQRIAAVAPLDDGYLQTNLLTLSWKRGIWLTVLFFTALLTAFALQNYQSDLGRYAWLVCFIPLVISSGGNSGTQSATLIITALTSGNVRVSDWLTIVWREWLTGLLLGTLLGSVGTLIALIIAPSFKAAIVIPITLLLVISAGTVVGSMLPLLFKRLGLDPALMSNPFISGIIDILGIVIYINVARIVLG
jgi:magnesium transporter